MAPSALEGGGVDVCSGFLHDKLRRVQPSSSNRPSDPIRMPDFQINRAAANKQTRQPPIITPMLVAVYASIPISLISTPYITGKTRRVNATGCQPEHRIHANYQGAVFAKTPCQLPARSPPAYPACRPILPTMSNISCLDVLGCGPRGFAATPKAYAASRRKSEENAGHRSAFGVDGVV